MKHNTCHVQMATLADLDTLTFAEKSCFPLDHWEKESVASQLTSPIGRSYIATYEGAFVGYVLVQFISPEWEILRIAILPSHRGQGLGKALLLAVHEQLKAEGGQNGYLEVRKSNLAAISLYTSCGYKHCGTRKQYYHHPTEDACLMSFDEER